jgi:hypothetical protein
MGREGGAGAEKAKVNVLLRNAKKLQLALSTALAATGVTINLLSSPGKLFKLIVKKKPYLNDLHMHGGHSR